jgi:glycosyltransferase involved in cell wall biosynthesis
VSRILRVARAGCDDTEVAPTPDRVLVVSHACTVAANQRVYADVAARGTPVHLVVPSRWANQYAPRGFDAEVLAGLAGDVTRVTVLGRGRPQRHVYLARCAALLARIHPRVVLIEEEPFSVAALQWSRAARRAGVPYGVQLAETLDRRLPSLVRRWRDNVLAGAAFVVARSPAAADLARRWGATGEVAVLVHGVEEAPERAVPTGPFTVAYVGRLDAEKGIEDLLDAFGSLEVDARLVVAGDGPLRGRVERAGASVTLLGAVPHPSVGDVYAMADLTCVPSRTTDTWEEQFGRVLVESLVRGVPVLATTTGSIPWVLGVTGGGVLVPERDPAALARAIADAAVDRAATAALGRAARVRALASFSIPAAADGVVELVARVSAR